MTFRRNYGIGMFCRSCGSPLYNKPVSKPDVLGIYVAGKQLDVCNRALGCRLRHRSASVRLQRDGSQALNITPLAPPQQRPADTQEDVDAQVGNGPGAHARRRTSSWRRRCASLGSDKRKSNRDDYATENNPRKRCDQRGNK
jgi:hypothetical protein